MDFPMLVTRGGRHKELAFELILVLLALGHRKIAKLSDQNRVHEVVV